MAIAQSMKFKWTSTYTSDTLNDKTEFENEISSPYCLNANELCEGFLNMMISIGFRKDQVYNFFTGRNNVADRTSG